MKIKETEFLEVEGWGKDGEIAHGFGTRGKSGASESKKDWWGQSVRAGEEIFPVISTRQVHGDHVVIFEGDPPKPDELWQTEGDSLVSRTPGYALAVFTADCLPILLFDPIRLAVGIVHAGWRGTAKGICQKAVKKMTEKFDSISEHLLVAMGPCIGPCCYEVDGPVREFYLRYEQPWEMISSPRGKGKWSLDLSKANEYLLQDAGVRKDHIRHLDLCTSCRRDLFFSYRAERETAGRQLNFIALRKKNLG